MLERKLRFETEMDDLRLLLMREPRGHSAMSGAILQPPARDDADWGVLFIEVSGCLPMCGHGTIGVATVLVESGMVEVREPETVVRLDTPAGLVEARVAVSGGRAAGVTLRNVPAFLLGRDRRVTVDGFGELAYDMAFGGNFYAILPAADAGLEVDPARSGELIERGLAIMAAINRAEPPVHPVDARLAGCRHVIFHAPGRDGASARNAVVDRAGLAGPLAVRHRHLGAHGAAARPRRAGGGRAVRQRVGDRDALHRPPGGRDRGRRAAGRRPGDHRAGVDHRARRVPARRRGPLPGRLRPVSADVAVVGAGIVGAAVARELAVRGVRVLLLDRGEVSGGSTGLGEGNVLCSDKDAGPELELTVLGLAIFDELEERLGPAARIRRKGALIVHPLASTWAAEPARLERLRAAGVDGVAVPAHEVSELEPALTGELCGASFFPRDLQCAPRAITRALAAEPGVEVRTGCRVDAVLVRDGRVAGLATADGEVPAGAVVLAAGAWTSALAETAGLRLPVEPRKGQLLLLRAPGGAGREPLLLHKVVDGSYLASVAEPGRRPSGHDGARDHLGGRRAGRLQPRAAGFRHRGGRRGERGDGRPRGRAHAGAARPAARGGVGGAAAVAARPPAGDRALAARLRGSGSRPATRGPASPSARSRDAWSRRPTAARRR